MYDDVYKYSLETISEHLSICTKRFLEIIFLSTIANCGNDIFIKTAHYCRRIAW
jgi:hypothetical protein